MLHKSETLRKARYGLAGALAIAMLAGVTSAANAVVITQTKSFDTYQYYYSTGNTGSYVTVNMGDNDYSSPFNMFDSSLGTLDSVKVTFRVTRAYRYAEARFYDPDWFSTTSGYAKMDSIDINFFLPGLTKTYGFGSISDTCSYNSGFGGSSCVAESSANTTGTAAVLLTGGAITGYIGAGTFSAKSDQDGIARFDETNGDNGYSDWRKAILDIDGTIEIEYNYTEASSPPPSTAMPEPGTLAVLGLGLAGIGFARRRR